MNGHGRRITRREWGMFLMELAIARRRSLGKVKFDAEFRHWDSEESEDVPGSHFVTYYARSAEDAHDFSDAVGEVARRRGWSFEGMDELGGFDENGFGPEESGPHKGRTLMEVFVTRGDG